MFKVGEVVIFLGGHCPCGFDGQECEIVGTVFGNPHCKCGQYLGERQCYWIKFSGAKKTYGVYGEWLKKKPPYDGNTKVSWKDIPYWKPKELVRV